MATLYIVATPIGNLKDITLRALEVFKSVDAIFCEDTRVTRTLLTHYEIDKPLYAYHQHSDSKKLIKQLEQGDSIAYVSDAGTPGIQDPGGRLIADVLQSVELRITNHELPKKSKINIVPIPGVSAVTALASVSGLPTDSFLFVGFIPKKKGRAKLLQEIADAQYTVICYESGHRIQKTLAELSDVLGASSRPIVIGRELTKKFETIYRGTISEVIDQLEASSQKGEFAVMIGN